MIEFVIRISNVTIGVLALHESTKKFCKDFICDGNQEFFVSVTQSDIDFEREQFSIFSET